MTDTIQLAEKCNFSIPGKISNMYMCSSTELEAFRKRIEDEIILKTLLTIRDHKGTFDQTFDLIDRMIAQILEGA